MRYEYDVFISHKHLDSEGNPTRDSHLAGEVFHHLKSRGLNVFLSKVSLELLGEDDYKHAIDDALDASTVLIAVGTSVANLESRWVRYEWDSFYKDFLSGENRHVFAYVEALNPRSLPRTLRHSQVFIHGSDSLERLSNYVGNLLRETTNAPAEVRAATLLSPEAAARPVRDARKTAPHGLEATHQAAAGTVSDDQIAREALVRKAEENRRAREEAETAARDEAARGARESRLAREAAARKAEEERLAREAAARKAEQERLAREAAARKAEEERQAREAAARKVEEERRAREAAARGAEQERLAREAAARRTEQDRLAREAAVRKAEEERLAREVSLKAWEERLVREGIVRKAEEQRLAQEAERQKLAREAEEAAKRAMEDAPDFEDTAAGRIELERKLRETLRILKIPEGELNAPQILHMAEYDPFALNWAFLRLDVAARTVRIADQELRDLKLALASQDVEYRRALAQWRALPVSERVNTKKPELPQE